MDASGQIMYPSHVLNAFLSTAIGAILAARGHSFRTAAGALLLAEGFSWLLYREKPNLFMGPQSTTAGQVASNVAFGVVGWGAARTLMQPQARGAVR